MSDRAIRWLFLASLAALAAWAVAHVDLSTDISRFMPDQSDVELASLASLLADSELTRTMILTVGADDPDAAVAAARALGDRLRGDPELASVRSGVDPEQLEEAYRLYFPRRHAFLSEDPEREIPALASPAALAQRARDVRASLALPTATLTKRLAATDPIGAFERLVGRLSSQRPPLDVYQGCFVTPDRRFAVLFLTTHHSAFDSEPQALLLAEIDAAFAEIAAASPVPLTLEKSGANRFAVAAEAGIRRDVHWIVAVSSLGVAVVFLAFLRSLRFFVLVVLPAVSGIVVGTVVTRLAFGRIDGVTMAFGACLIGVAIDYSIHVLDHHALDPEVPIRALVRRLRASVLVGGLTTMASFVGLALTSFPGFREIGFFSTVGIGASLFVTLSILPAFLSGALGERSAPPLATRVSAAFGDGVRWLAVHPAVLTAATLACIAVSAAFAPRLRFDDDLTHLMSLDPRLRAEEDRVRARVAREDAGRVIFALGADADEAVARNDAVAARLADAHAAGQVGEFRSLHALLWSRELQLRNLRALASIPDLADRVETAFAAEGFRPEALAPFRAALAEPAPDPLDAAALRASPLSDLVAPLLLDLGDRAAAVTYLRGAAEPEQLEAVLAGLEHVHVFDQKTFMNAIYRQFRVTTIDQMGVGSGLVVLVLALYYRRLRPALAAFLPSLLVGGAVVAVFAAVGAPMNLLHVTSLVMVMGMGVDYGVFIVDSARDRKELDGTLFSLFLSCITTVFVFGTLAISQHAALRAMGATTGLGILLSFALAPVTLLLLPRAERVP
ncbi:MAG TPA: MMPL family transporter [Myxococcota bacterium]|nr:MMPL family transporter [Myxococcota bacterium]